MIGEDDRLHANVGGLRRVPDRRSRCILQAGAVVGSDGFGYVWDGDRHRKIPQVGIVRLEDDVEVGANAAIDRATLGETVVGRGTKIDNLVQVGHNVVIGEHSLLCGQAGVAGSTRIGRRVTLAGQAGVADHATIGDGAIATAQSGIVTGGDGRGRSRRLRDAGRAAPGVLEAGGLGRTSAGARAAARRARAAAGRGRQRRERVELGHRPKS